MSRDIRDLERWIEDHPVHTRLTTIGLAILVLELAGFIRYGMEWLARCVQ